MKKRLSIILIGALVMVFALAGCGNGGSADKTDKKDSSNKKISVVTTIFPEYDWTKEVLGEKAKDAEITMLLDDGVDLHSYQPSAKDIEKISSCDVFVYVGGESDEWVEDALKEATNKDMQVVNLMDTLGDKVKNEEVKEGMQTEEHHHHDGDKDDDDDHHDKHHDSDKDEDYDHDKDEHHDKDEDHDHDKDEHHHHDGDDPEKDEHVWLSLKSAQTCTTEIANAIGAVDKENKDTYLANAKAYNKKLANLDKEYSDAVKSASKKTLLFGDRFPFRYMVEDYKLDYFAAFVGCSAESEASFKTIKFLANKMDQLGLKNVMTIENNDHKIAKTIIKNTNKKDQDILTMDSMQSTTAKDVEKGATYLDIMTKNLKVLKKALQ